MNIQNVAELKFHFKNITHTQVYILYLYSCTELEDSYGRNMWLSDFEQIRAVLDWQLLVIYKHNGCTILISIFIYISSLHVSGIHVPHHQEKIGVWSAGWIQSNQQTRRHPHRVTNTSVA